jgi:hypothetical protein
MKVLVGQFRRRFLGLSPEEITCARRGFRVERREMQIRIEQVGSAFSKGYHAALAGGAPARVLPELKSVALELRGFAFEGAAMGLALLDALSPWSSSRISDFLRGDGEPHTYMVHVGVGWVWARLPLGLRPARQRLDPLLQWLAFDGWGFHEGFFHWPNYVHGQARPRRLANYEKRAFDQGLGRSWWFVNGGNPELIAGTIARFSPERQPDMWSGIGLAAGYAGLVSESILTSLRHHAGSHLPSLAQGAAFAAKARQRAGNPSDCTELASEVLCGLPAAEAARLCDNTLLNLPAGGRQPAFEVWRERIQHHFSESRAIQKPEQLQPA